MDREDDLASKSLCGITAFAAAVFKVIESQQRGFAPGHGKVHSVPDGSKQFIRGCGLAMVCYGFPLGFQWLFLRKRKGKIGGRTGR